MYCITKFFSKTAFFLNQSGVEEFNFGAQSSFQTPTISIFSNLSNLKKIYKKPPHPISQILPFIKADQGRLWVYTENIDEIILLTNLLNLSNKIWRSSNGRFHKIRLFASWRFANLKLLEKNSLRSHTTLSPISFCHQYYTVWLSRDEDLLETKESWSNNLKNMIR